LFSKKEFASYTGIVVFANLCSGSYFIDIRNGESVAVGPIHALRDNHHLEKEPRLALPH